MNEWIEVNLSWKDYMKQRGGVEPWTMLRVLHKEGYTSNIGETVEYLIGNLNASHCNEHGASDVGCGCCGGNDVEPNATVLAERKVIDG